MKTIVTVNGWWSTNIGNSFFQIGAEYLLKRALPDYQILPISDLPGYWNVLEGNPKNSYIPVADVEADYVVFHGPLFRKEFDRISLEVLKKLHKRGVKIIILAAGMMHYDEQSVKYYEEWMSEIPIHLLTSRDSFTFNKVHKFANEALDAVDIAFFIKDAYPAPKLDVEEYVAFNFDQVPEPKIIFGNGKINVDETTSISLEFNEFWWNTYWKRKWVPFAEGVIGYNRRPKQNKKIGKYNIIRTDHRFNPYHVNKVYSGEHTFASDTPYGYLTIYRNAYATFTNRVHATVATLAYGNKAMLFSKSPRAKLLERAGVTEVKQNLVSLDLNHIEIEKQKIVDFIKSNI